MAIEKIILENLKVKDCEDKDYDLVRSITKENMGKYIEKFWGGWDDKKFQANFKKQNIKIIEYMDKQIGFYDIEIINGYLYVHNLQIISSYQGKGIGKYMMRLMENEAKNHGIKKIEFGVFKENPAKEFYLRLGYIIKNDNGSTVKMEKEL